MNAPDTIEAEELLLREISIRPKLKSPNGQDRITLKGIILKIKEGEWREQIEAVRSSKSLKKKSQLKENLPVVNFSGVFNGLRKDSLVRHSGLLCLDFDHLNENVEQFRRRLSIEPHVLGILRSPSLTGLKVIVPIEASNSVEHENAFLQAKNHFAPLLPQGAKLDESPKHVAANCFITFDPEPWVSNQPRLVFSPECGAQNSPEIDHEGGYIDSTYPGIQSNEKELSPLPASQENGETERGSRDIEGYTPYPPDRAPLHGIITTKLYPKWMAFKPHREGNRNATIVDRVPLLNNLVGPQLTAAMLLEWYDHAPPSLFKNERQKHWNETWSMIDACLKSYSINKKVGLNKREEHAYENLETDRQRSAFRIFFSLAQSLKNELGRFNMSAHQLGQRLQCADPGAMKTIEQLISRKIIERTSEGARWTKGHQPRACGYAWVLRKWRTKESTNER